MEAAYTLYIEGTGIAGSGSLEQVKLLALDHLREGRHLAIRTPGGMLLVYDEARRDWSEDIREPCLPPPAGMRTGQDNAQPTQQSFWLAASPRPPRKHEFSGGKPDEADRSEPGPRGAGRYGDKQ